MPEWLTEKTTGKRIYVKPGLYISFLDDKYYERKYKIDGNVCHISDREISKEEYDELLKNKEKI